MSSCQACGHEVGVGPSCVSCGAVVDSSTSAGDWRTDTAERKLPRPAPDPRTPPSAVGPPPPPRYPLYADEVPHYAPYGPLTTSADPGATSVLADAGPSTAAPAARPAQDPYLPSYEPGHEPSRDVGYDTGYRYEYAPERRSPVLWILAAALAMVVVAVGWWSLVRDNGSAGGPDDGSAAQASTAGQDAAGELAGRAAAKAPRTAPPNKDVDGKEVSYDASNMLDGVPDTAWRVAGDATGMKLTFTLHQGAELRRVGLINGYAKTSTDNQGRTFDWYLGNRRIKAVVWVFDNGSKVRQQLHKDRKLQMIDLTPVTTKQVVLRLVSVSKPGTGTASRNFTAISEVSLVGVPAG